MIEPRLGLLFAGCALFGGIIALELRAGDGLEKPIAMSPVRADSAPPIPTTHPARLDELLAVSLARPLFSPTRRAPATPQGDGEAASELRDKRLAGIVIEPDRRFAIFAVNGAKPLTVNEGELIDGWRVETIAPGSVGLSSPSGTRTLQPKMDASLVRQPQTPAPARTAPSPAAIRAPATLPGAAPAPVGAVAPLAYPQGLRAGPQAGPGPAPVPAPRRPAVPSPR